MPLYDESHYLRSRAINNAERQTENQERHHRRTADFNEKKERARARDAELNREETRNYNRAKLEDANRNHRETLANNSRIQEMRSNTALTVAAKDRDLRRELDDKRNATAITTAVINGQTEIQKIITQGKTDVVVRYSTLSIDVMFHHLDTERAYGLAAMDIVGKLFIEREATRRLEMQINANHVDDLEKYKHELEMAKRAHDYAIGADEARHQRDVFFTVIKSRLHNEEVTHAEIIRLITRIIEGANARASDRDAKKWASECMDEWERERKGRI